jgi:adenylate cyclase
MQVKGKRELERIYTILGRANATISSDFLTLNERNGAMLAAYRRHEWQQALEMILLCRELGKNFGLDDYYDLYIQRIRRLIDSSASSH